MICDLYLKSSIKLSNLWSKKVIKTFEKIDKNNNYLKESVDYIN